MNRIQLFKKAKQMTTFSIACFLAVNASSDPWVPANSEYTTITHLYPGQGGLTFMLAEGNSDYSTCDGGKRFHVNIDDIQDQILASSIMMAYTANKRIRININGVSEEPKCGFPINRAIITD